MLVDDVTITVKAGDGGDGKMSLKRNGQTSKGGPDGGNGGNGGDIYIKGVSDLSVLQQFQFKKSLKGESGIPGGKNNLYGKNAPDLAINVPIGTRITDCTNGQVIEIRQVGDRVLVAKGGKGGRGNNEFKTATNQTPTYAEKGEHGEEKKLRFELLLIADVGLIGLPNAGKSSLLEALTNASPKIGNYPFTTIEPNLGVMDGIILADIPGLIEGASVGKGLGIKFLKHIERTRLLLHCIDSTAGNVLAVYETVQKEFSEFNPELLKKEEIVLLTKSDMVSEKELDTKLSALKTKAANIIVASIYDDSTLEILRKKLLEKCRGAEN